MNTIIIEGVKPWDGSYPFDITDENLTGREWRWIRDLAKYLPLQLWGGVQGGDPDIFAVFAIITLRRLGKIDANDVEELWERFSEVPIGSVRLELDEVGEDDAGPPAGSSTSSSPSSGTSSNGSSEASETGRSRSGTPGSATSVPAPATSLT